MHFQTVADIERTYLTQGINLEIAAGDQFWSPLQAEYYSQVGRSALYQILGCLSVSHLHEVNTILDLPSGHGRVARHLRAAFPSAQLTFCDIERDAVDFCARAFSGTGVYAEAELSAVRLPNKYDIIWVGSLFTHVDLDRTARWLKFLCSHLTPDGILLATFHGLWTKTVQERYSQMIDVQSWHNIIEQFEQSGYGFASYPASIDYGISLCEPSTIVKIASRIDGIRIVSLTERGWADNQDVMGLARTDRLQPW